MSTAATTTALLTAETYKTGLIHDDVRMAGVVALPTGGFAVFVTEMETARTTHYQEFPALDEALNHAAILFKPGSAHFEAFGCDKGSSCRGAQKGACTSCGNNEHDAC
jgi:hypothetical protein